MNRCARWPAMVVALAWPLAAHAVDADENAALLESAPNGCGAGWSVYLVPDSIPLAACSFKKACDGHDDCYGKCAGRDNDPSVPECEYLRCKSGGDLHGSAQCRNNIKFARLASEASKRREACDVSIGKDIIADNRGNPVCVAFSIAYQRAVKAFGENFFQGIERPDGHILQSKEDYETAIRDFFRNGTEEEFRAFNANPPDFDRDLGYVPGRGLVNVERDPL